MATSAADLSDWRSSRAKIGALSRSRNSDDPELIEARRDLRAARLAEHIRRVVEEAPPLTADQRDRLTILLHSGTSANGGDAA